MNASARFMSAQRWNRISSAGAALLEPIESRVFLSGSLPTFTLGANVSVNENAAAQTMPNWAGNFAAPAPITIGPHIYASAADQPQLTAVAYDGTNAITDSSGNPISFDAYIDTGASGSVISYLTSAGFTTAGLLGDETTVEGLGLGTTHGTVIGQYTDSGVGGPETGNVISPIGVGIRNGTVLSPTIDPDTLEIIPPDVNLSEFTSYGPLNLWVRQQEGFGERQQFMGMDLDVTPMNVLGMPIIQNTVMVMDPTTIGSSPDGLSVTGMDTDLLPKGSAVPATNLDFKLRMQDFVGATPAPGETFPSHARNPVFDNVTISQTDGGTTKTSTGNTWLFDTGSGSTMIGFEKAKEIGLIDPSYATFDDFMANFTGITLPIAGVGSITDPVYAPILTLSEVDIPAADGRMVTWQNVDVLVVDVPGLDGVFGLNLLLPASTIDPNALTEVGSNDGVFDKIIFDAHADNTADLSLMYDPGTTPPPPATPTLTFQVTADNKSLFSVQPAIASDGTLSFTPAAEAYGTAHLTVTASDGSQTSLPQSFDITINPVNDAPTATGQSRTALPGQPLTLTLAGADEETPAGSLVFNVPARSGHGTLTPLGGAQYLYTPDGGFVGQDSFDFTVTDTGAPGGDGSDALTSPAATVNLQVYYSLSLNAKGQAQYHDANNDLVTVSLTGGGTGQLYFEHAQPCDLSSLVLTGTTDRSTLTIKVAGSGARTSAGGLEVDGPIHTISAGTTDVTGQVSIGSSTKVGSAASLTLGRLTDAAITSQMPLGTVKVVNWLDTDSTVDTLTAPTIAAINAAGLAASRTAAAVAGDFEADVQVNGGVAKNALGSVSIAGSLIGRQWNVTGSVGTFTVAEKVKPMPGTADVQVRASGGIASVTVGAAEHADFLAGIRPADPGEDLRRAAAHADFASSVAIGKFTVKGLPVPRGQTPPRFFVDSNVSAAKIGTTSLYNVDMLAPDPFGLYAATAASIKTGGIVSVRWHDSQFPKDPAYNGSWLPRNGNYSAGPQDKLQIMLL